MQGHVPASNRAFAADTGNTPLPLDLQLPGRSSEAGYARPPRAPSGEDWPRESDYVPGFKRLFDGGANIVEIDNTRNDFDVYLKLYAERDTRAFAVRWLFIRAHDSFLVKGIRPGRYDVRYRNLDTGYVARSDPFELAAASAGQPKAVRMTIRLATPAPKGDHSPPDADF
jgi:hypothetical protein